MTSIEPTGGRINDLCAFTDSGLMLLALDSSQIPSYFIPSLGPAPKWCSYLENLTVWCAPYFVTLSCQRRWLFWFEIYLQEELEEQPQTTIYDDFKFLTKEDLEKLNLTHLIGTSLLRAYMHGYFIDYRLYKKVTIRINLYTNFKWLALWSNLCACWCFALAGTSLFRSIWLCCLQRAAEPGKTSGRACRSYHG